MNSILIMIVTFGAVALAGFIMAGIVNVFFWLIGLVYQGIEKLIINIIGGNKDV